MLPTLFACLFAVPTLHTVGYAVLWYFVLKALGRNRHFPCGTCVTRVRRWIRTVLSLRMLGYGSLLVAGVLEFSEAFVKHQQAPAVGVAKPMPQPGK